MRLNKFFLKTTKDITQEAKLISHRLMMKSGMIKQSSAGVYSWLPLGVLVLQNISNIIKEELNKISANEVILPNLQPIGLWEKSGRAAADNELGTQIFRLHDAKKQNYVLPASGEEVITDLFNKSVKSYKELGQVLYQITWKFRDEIRPRHGVMRGKEFLMKDAYSFDATEFAALANYEKIFTVYLKIFAKMGFSIIPVMAPTGSMGGSYSHEFHVLTQNGESNIYYEPALLDYLRQVQHSKKLFSLQNFEKFYAREEGKHQNIVNKALMQNKSIEVGHMFYLGDKYTRSLECSYQGEDNQMLFPFMGCYGIGISRLIAAIIESNHDDKGIIWPVAVSPFKVVIINCQVDDFDHCTKMSEQIYKKLNELKIPTLYDDSKKSIGKKFADMDLIGIPYQIIIGKKNSQKGKLEVKERPTGKITLHNLVDFLQNPQALINCFD